MNLKEFFDIVRTKSVNIAVIGDVMQDEYIHGIIPRVADDGLSIFTQQKAVRVAGGAGNVANQLLGWNVDVLMPGCVRWPTCWAPTAWSAEIPRKRRFLCANRTVFRDDLEYPNYKLDEQAIHDWRAEIMAQLKAKVSVLKVLILSDYNKGLLSPEFVDDVLTLCRENGVTTIVDPKQKPALYLKGDILKCSSSYAYNHEIGPHAGVITTNGPLSPETRLGDTIHPCRKRTQSPSKNTVGAGDAFISGLAVAIAHGLPLLEAVEVGYSAGRMYVQEWDNALVSPAKVYRDLDPAGKIVRRVSDIPDKENLILASGCFDLLHPGHMEMLRWAKNHGGTLVIGVNSDDSVKRLKGANRPRIIAYERMQALAALECVDWVLPFEEDTPVKLICELKPSLMVKGPDWTGKTIPEEALTKVIIAPQGFFTFHSSDMELKSCSTEQKSSR